MFGNAVKQPGLELRRQAICRETVEHSFVKHQQTDVCQHKMNWRIWGCKQLSASWNTSVAFPGTNISVPKSEK